MQSVINLPPQFQKLKKGHNLYLLFVGLCGFVFVGIGIVQLPNQSNIPNLLILICLAAMAEVAAPFLNVGKTKVAYEVGTAVSLAAVPLFGAATGSLVICISGLCYWLYKYRTTPFAKRRWDQLIFNIGMRSCAIFIAGSFLYYSLHLLDSENTNIVILVWILAAIILDQLNLWLLIILMRLLKGKEINPLSFWAENRWAMIVNIAVESIGGFALATALAQYGRLGIFVFFLPIGLSAISFQLYVRRMRAHMDNLEAIIEDRTQELAGLLKEKDAFLAVLTHDMKTPLTSINLYGSLLKDKPHLASENPRIVATILRGQKTLTNIVNDILDIEKLESNGALPMQVEPLDFGVLLSASVETLHAQAMKKDIVLHYDAPISEIRVQADRSQIERIFQNILSNAIKYTPEEGSVFVRVKTQEKHVCLEVEDTGYGIPAEELPYIFDRYRRVKKHVDKASGTGLGLAITKGLVESHDGEIEAQSVEGKGSVFTVKMPLAERSRLVS